MATSRLVMLMVIATLVVLFVGSADAEPKCMKDGDCVKKPHYTVKCVHKTCVYKCDAVTYNDEYYCGECNKCKEKPHYTVKCVHKKCVYKYKCDADTHNDVYNCGKCGKKCYVHWKNGRVTCKGGYCKQECKHGYKYVGNKRCVPKKY